LLKGEIFEKGKGEGPPHLQDRRSPKEVNAGRARLEKTLSSGRGGSCPRSQGTAELKNPNRQKRKEKSSQVENQGAGGGEKNFGGNISSAEPTPGITLMRCKRNMGRKGILGEKGTPAREWTSTSKANVEKRGRLMERFLSLRAEEERRAKKTWGREEMEKTLEGDITNVLSSCKKNGREMTAFRGAGGVCAQEGTNKKARKRGSGEREKDAIEERTNGPGKRGKTR